MIRLGYCCINLELSDKGISTNHSMIKKTFQQKGMPYVEEKILQNLKSLKEVIQWNYEKDIHVYRMSSSLFPWMSEYEISNLQNPEIFQTLKECGDLAKKYNQRLSFHPGPFNVLASPNQSLIIKTIKELNQHSEIMNLMGLEESHFYPINIHVGGFYDSKENTLNRFCDNFSKLSEHCQKRLVVENDDKKSMYSVKDLSYLNKQINIPITFDFFHHNLHSDNLSEEQALKESLNTWDCIPLTHYSSSRKIHEDSSVKEVSHANFIYEKIQDYDLIFDVELEAKMKEIALFNYFKIFSLQK